MTPQQLVNVPGKFNALLSQSLFLALSSWLCQTLCQFLFKTGRLVCTSASPTISPKSTSNCRNNMESRNQSINQSLENKSMGFARRRPSNLFPRKGRRDFSIYRCSSTSLLSQARWRRAADLLRTSGRSPSKPYYPVTGKKEADIKAKVFLWKAKKN